MEDDDNNYDYGHDYQLAEMDWLAQHEICEEEKGVDNINSIDNKPQVLDQHGRHGMIRDLFPTYNISSPEAFALHRSTKNSHTGFGN